jgi:hypothetical protein
MNLKDFMVIVKGLNEEAEDTLDVANSEYATDESKFNNFEITANILRAMNPRLSQIQPEDVALIFMMKHLFSIAKGVSLREDMRGRYKDCLNYIHLHHGIWNEKKQQSDEATQRAESLGERFSIGGKNNGVTSVQVES